MEKVHISHLLASSEVTYHLYLGKKTHNPVKPKPSIYLIFVTLQTTLAVFVEIEAL